MDLPGFLLARIAEDEAAARESGADAMVGWRWKHYPPEAYEEVQALTLAHSARVIAKCKADRKIVDLHSGAAPACAWTQDSSTTHDDEGEDTCDTMRALALPYADHPDYDESWRL